MVTPTAISGSMIQNPMSDGGSGWLNNIGAAFGRIFTQANSKTSPAPSGSSFPTPVPVSRSYFPHVSCSNGRLHIQDEPDNPRDIVNTAFDPSNAKIQIELTNVQRMIEAPLDLERLIAERIG